MTETIYTVTGMTAACCASAVTEEVATIDGVRNVVVDLPTGRVTVASDKDLSVDDVRAAVEEAGYELAS